MNSTWNNQTFSINKYRDVENGGPPKSTSVPPAKKIYYKTDTNFVKKAQAMRNEKIVASGQSINNGQSNSLGPTNGYKQINQNEDPEYRPKTSFNNGRIETQDILDKNNKKRPSKFFDLKKRFCENYENAGSE
jgi:hypothetical protein